MRWLFTSHYSLTMMAQHPLKEGSTLTKLVGLSAKTEEPDPHLQQPETAAPSVCAFPDPTLLLAYFLSYSTHKARAQAKTCPELLQEALGRGLFGGSVGDRGGEYGDLFTRAVKEASICHEARR